MSMFLEKEQKEQIGFNFIMDKLQVITPFGMDEKRNVKPFYKKDLLLLQEELDNVEKVMKSYNNYKGLYLSIERVFMKFKNIKHSLKRCDNDEILDDVELYEIKIFSMALQELIEIFSCLNKEISLYHIDFVSLDEITHALDPDNSLIPTFHIYDSYSSALKDIREHKRSLEKEILSSSHKDTIALLKEKRLAYVLQESEEELVIRKNLSLKIKSYTDIFYNNIDSLGNLDFLIAKAKLAITYNCVKPLISHNMSISLKGAQNPAFAHILESKGKIFTPLDLDLDHGTTVITGANMGGKSVTLKTLALNILLVQMGFFPFCKKAQVPILDFIYFISDDMQCVSQGLSTFGAEIMKLKIILNHSKRNHGLIILDEFARGTNPKEGFFLVKALSVYLNNLESISIISTHYDNVAEDNMTHYQVIGLKNADFEALKRKLNLNKSQSVDIIQDNMDYRLELVSRINSVPKDALNICMLLGLDKEVLEIAKTYYKEDQ